MMLLQVLHVVKSAFGGRPFSLDTTNVKTSQKRFSLMDGCTQVFLSLNIYLIKKDEEEINIEFLEK